MPTNAPAGCALRVETGVRAGDAISPFYDPMIAKLVAHGPDRAAALDALVGALEETEIAGSVTNAAFLAALARDADFAAGEVDTGLIARKQEALTALPAPSARSIAQAALAASRRRRNAATSDDPWSALAGYAHFHPVERQDGLNRHGDEEIVARISARTGWPARRQVGAASRTVRRLGVDRPCAGHSPAGRAMSRCSMARSAIPSPSPIPSPRRPTREAGTASMRAPMPGLVKVVRAAKGDAVIKGQPLLILEAMKMEHTIAAPHDGVIAEIATEGAQITDGTVLVRFEESRVR